MPLLVGAAVAGVQDQLCPVGGIGGRVVEAFTGCRVDQLPAHCLPLLIGTPVAGPPLDQGAVRIVRSGDVHAAAVDLQRAVAGHGPVLRGGITVAIPYLDLVSAGSGAVVVVDALGAAEAGGDRSGRPATAAGVGRVTGRDDVGLDRAL